MKYAPIALFVYNRPTHTKRTIDALCANVLAGESDLFIFSDAPKKESAAAAVSEVRELIRSVNEFKTVHIVEREQNLGLARSIIAGVTEIVEEYGQIIVLEDDMVTSPYFLQYMNDALERYAENDRVVSIHGYVYPVAVPLPEAFFLPGADCWGWATWRRGWECFNPDGTRLLQELKRRRLECAFDYEGSYPYVQMLKDQIAGTNDSWAIRWYASAFLMGKLTLYPGRSLIHNIGNDGTGTHCGQSGGMDASLSDCVINLDGVAVEPNMLARQEFVRFFSNRPRPGISGWVRRLLSLFGRKQTV